MFKQKPLAAAVSMAVWSLAAVPAMAQDVPSGQIQTVEVTGIRASMAKSLAVKRDSAANVEVITAEDVGKMPDKNLADSLQRLAGVAVRTDYDEAEKVAMRGSNPDHTLILFNGHTVSGGDWYVADQLSSSRSTSLSLMPSSVLNQAVVYKTSSANLVDGGMAGTINVSTRKPLAQKERLTGIVNLGGVYSELPGKAAHDLNASMNWKNESNTFGFIMQGFAEKRFVRRDSASRFAYVGGSGWDVINTSTMLGITDASLAGTGYKASDLNGVRIPGSMSTEFVESVRDRKGGMFSAQFKPNADLDMTMTGFHSEMKADNFGRLNAGAMFSMLRGQGGAQGATTPTLSNGQRVYAQIKNPVIVTERTVYGHDLKVLKSADIVYPAGTTPQYIGETEGAYREGAKATSAFLDLDVKYRVNQDLSLKGLFSTTKGVGQTGLDQGLTYTRYGTGVRYALGALRDAPFVQYLGTGPNVPGRNADGSGFVLTGRAASGVKTTDKENSLQLDAEYRLDREMVKSLEFGARHADHRRESARRFPQLRTGALSANEPVAGSNFIPYPSDFGADLDGPAGWDNTSWTLTPEALKAYFAANYKPTSADWERRTSTELDMRERQSSAFVMANLEGNKWSGNIGLRYVRTQVNAAVPSPIPVGLCPRTEPGKPATTCAAVPGAITTASDGVQYYDGVPFNPLAGVMYYKQAKESTFNNLLPSMNIRYELEKDHIVRVGISKTISRQNYNLLGAGYGSPTCTDGFCQVTGPNPNLEPLFAKNIDLSYSWYMGRRSMFGFNIFASDITGYPKTGIAGQDTVQLLDPRDSQIKSFAVNSASQQGARIAGIEIMYEQPFGNSPFGFTSNVSKSRTRVDDGRPMVGASEYAANLGVYFENDKLSARLVANYRSEYINTSTAPAPNANSQGLSTINGILMPVAPTYAAPVTTLAFNSTYNLMPNLQLSFSATNLTNVKRAYYRYSEEEQQKLDVSGRIYYLNLKYRF
ncbi:TonB-dependent receptor [Massilia yuzhufengensis]|uniref:Iron complex outermembrane recepter protein n=1 Tax=Massilia yuzhufengensis TaxID=1164594 RepID=A0A1I1EJH4_9BURK|nr:TonB-dependent receptor [Massilia yuzhufengensis]SFB85073.1 iron complex outermembrane recepter protein [Massilia yuzhufengensis]